MIRQDQLSHKSLDCAKIMFLSWYRFLPFIRMVTHHKHQITFCMGDGGGGGLHPITLIHILQSNDMQHNYYIEQSYAMFHYVFGFNSYM